MKKTTVVLTRTWTTPIQDTINERFDARLNESDKILTQNEILDRCHGATVLCPSAFDVIDSSLISGLPDSVKLIATISAGTQHIDIEAASEKGIYVSNTPDVVAEDTADLTFGLLLSVSRRIVELDQVVRDSNWKGFKVDDPLSGIRVWGKTIGIVGLGGIGKAVARRARAFQMNVLYHNRKRDNSAKEEFDARYFANLSEMLREADVVSLHCPLTSETKHLISDHALTAMKPTAILLNTSRGNVIDETALIHALTNNSIAGAGLDVYSSEPNINADLLSLPNTVFSPHIGTATIETRNDMGLRVIENIEAFINTGQPKDTVTG